MSRHVAVALLVTLAACGGGGGGSGGGGGAGGEPAPWETGSYDPPWKNVSPAATITFTYNGGQTSQQNGAALAAAIQALQPGQRLEIGNGTYSINLWFDIVLQGTSSAPIWIVAAAGATPVLTRPDAAQNVINVGSGSPTRYLCLRGLEITGGDDLLRLYDCSNVWIDQCHIHHGSGVGIAANSHDTDHLYITRNEIHRPGGAADTAECMYLGANNSVYRMTRSVIALNHCYDTTGTLQGDGIEVKQGSHTNWIAENHVHDTNYPCLLVYGTDGLGINLVERNDLHGSADNTLQVQGESVVRNNMIMAGAGAGFASTDHQGSTVNLTFVHNTIVNAGRAANLSSWNGRAGMVFANNAVYSQTLESIHFPSGSTGVTLAGNVVIGGVVGASGGFVTGTGLTDFTLVTWSASSRNALPSAGSPLIGAGAAAHAEEEDFTGAARTLPVDAGAYESP